MQSELSDTLPSAHGAFITEKELSVVSSDVRFIDVRFNLKNPIQGRFLFDKSRLPGAVYADINSDLSVKCPSKGRHPLPSLQQFKSWLVRNGLDARPHASTVIVVYDQSRGVFAARAWWMLRAVGYSQVHILHDGFNGWKGMVEKGSPSDYSSFANDAFAVKHVYNDLPISWEKSAFPLVHLSELSKYKVVDARPGQRFHSRKVGLAQDTIPGHYPGALNCDWEKCDPYSSLTKEQLREIFDMRTDGNTSENSTPLAAVMCGSGVTACYIIACVHHVNVPIPALYVGSWSEIEYICKSHSYQESCISVRLLGKCGL